MRSDIKEENSLALSSATILCNWPARERANAVPCVPPPTGVISFSAQDPAHSRNKLLADDSCDITLHTHTGNRQKQWPHPNGRPIWRITGPKLRGRSVISLALVALIGSSRPFFTKSTSSAGRDMPFLVFICR